MRKGCGDFAFRLNKAMHDKGIYTPSELAQLAGIHRITAGSYMRGERKASFDACYQIANALCVDPYWLRGLQINDQPAVDRAKGTWLSYQEAGERLGISAEAARQRALRAKWPKRLRNDGVALVLVPDETPEEEGDIFTVDEIFTIMEIADRAKQKIYEPPTSYIGAAIVLDDIRNGLPEKLDRIVSKCTRVIDKAA